MKRDSVKERKITELTNTTVNTQNSLSEKKQISTQFLHSFFFYRYFKILFKMCKHSKIFLLCIRKLYVYALCATLALRLLYKVFLGFHIDHNILFASLSPLYYGQLRFPATHLVCCTLSFCIGFRKRYQPINPSFLLQPTLKLRTGECSSCKISSINLFHIRCSCQECN